MDKLSMVLAALAALSLATERLTETIKGLPFLAKWLATEQTDAHLEEVRKASIHIIAIAIGTVLAWQANLLSTLLDVKNLPPDKIWVGNLLLGAMASGGSGIWNSALDIVRQVNKQKTLVSDQMKENAAASKPLRDNT